MYSSENAGLVKFDLLGLQNLTSNRDKTVKMLNLKGKKQTSKINLSDERVFQLYQSERPQDHFNSETLKM